MKKIYIKKIPGLTKIYFLFKYINNYFFYILAFFKFKSLSRDLRFKILWRDRRPCLKDNTKFTDFDRHYIYHPAWAARILAKINPKEHVDISSTLHFCSLISAFIPTKFYDFRPAELKLNNLEISKADLTALPFENDSIISLSCMHTIEHIGLGRYGDPINPEADLKAFSELERVLANNGNLLLVIPIGIPKICFNAYRVYSYQQIIDNLPSLTLVEFSLIPDKKEDGDILSPATKEMANKQNYGCGCFWFTKKLSNLER